MTRFALSLIAILLGATTGYAQERRPNFLVILCDDLGYGDLGCYGHPHIKTPNLDRLAQDGIRFTSGYSSAPVCSPSRAGLLTSKTPSRLGIFDWISPGNVVHLQRGELTIAEMLRRAGYATAHVGKWHLNGKFNNAEQPQPGDMGFEHWMSTQNNAAPTHKDPNNFVRNGQAVGKTQGYSCQVVADEAARWPREDRKSEKPFFLFVCFHEPHEPVESPPDLVANYADAKEHQAQYFANVTNMDRAVGKLVKTLDDLKVADNTLVLFTSDNGPETLSRYKGAFRSYGSPGRLRGMKLHLYEGGIRVPWIARWTGKIKGGQTTETAISNLDVLPTLCQLAGVETLKNVQLDGTSIVPSLEGKELTRSRPLFWHYYRAIGAPKAALRAGDWMVLGHWDGDINGPGGSIQPGDSQKIKASKLVAFELYNLKTDPEQKTDLATMEPARLAEMSAQLRARYDEVLRDAPNWAMQGKKE